MKTRRNTMFAALALFSFFVPGGMSSQVNAQTLTTLASFNGSNGQGPEAGLTLSGNTLYGTTSGGGVYGWGTVFSLPLGGGNGQRVERPDRDCKTPTHPS